MLLVEGAPVIVFLDGERNPRSTIRGVLRYRPRYLHWNVEGWLDAYRNECPSTMYYINLDADVVVPNPYV